MERKSVSILLGVPIFFLINLRNRIGRLFRKNNDLVVIIAFHKIGDTVFTIPTVERIVAKEKNVHLFCFYHSVPIYQLVLKDNIRFVPFSKMDFKYGERVAKADIRRQFKQLNPSKIIDITGSTKSVSTFIFNNANQITGFNSTFYKTLYTNFYSGNNIEHIIELYPRKLGWMPEISIDELLSRFSIVPRNSGPILIHPFAGWASKEWGLNKFIVLAQRLQKIKDCEILIPEGSLSDAILEEINFLSIKVIKTENIDKLIYHINNAFLLIGNDSGSIYIADLLGVPNFTIFGPSNPKVHFFKLKYSDYINIELPCSPKGFEKLCFTDGGRSGCPSNECMQQLSVDIVYHKILQLIERIEKNYE